ncbi:hypothetical protein [Piscirickettsia salmonis]|nr:hypothetical protein [Piscirickettsia salmonis]
MLSTPWLAADTYFFSGIICTLSLIDYIQGLFDNFLKISEPKFLN